MDVEDDRLFPEAPYDPGAITNKKDMVAWLNSGSIEAKMKVVEYYQSMKLIKAVSGSVLFFCFLALAIASGVDEDIDGRVYVTLAPVERNGAPPPDVWTRFRIIGDDGWRLLFFMFIPCFAAIFHLALVLPNLEMLVFNPIRCFRCLWMPITSSFDMDNWQKFDFDYRDDPVKPGFNEYEGRKTFDNQWFNQWFKFNLLFGGSGIKFIPYALSSGVFAVMVCELVGVTDILQLISVFMFTFLGNLQLWYLEYAYASDVDFLTAAKKGKVASSLKWTVDVSWILFSMAAFCVFFPIVIFTTYFAFLESAGDARWYVWVAFLWFSIHCVAMLLLLWVHHMDLLGGIMKNYVFIEGFMIAGHAAMYAIVPMMVIFGSRNTGYLYGITVPP